MTPSSEDLFDLNGTADLVRFAPMGDGEGPHVLGTVAVSSTANHSSPREVSILGDLESSHRVLHSLLQRAQASPASPRT